MNGELTVLGEGLLLFITLLYSLAGIIIGRRLPAPASLAAYGSAMAVWGAFPLLAEANLHRVDQTVGIVGFGLLLVHVAHMALFAGNFLTVVFITQPWSWRHRLAMGGSVVLTVVFGLYWLAVKGLPLAETAPVFYGVRAGHPPAVLGMNVSMGAGLVYIAAWNVLEFWYFFRGARLRYEQGTAMAGVLLYLLSAVAGTLTVAEAVGRQQGFDVAKVPQVKAHLALLLIAATGCIFAYQLWLRPFWRQWRQWLVRYVAPDLLQLQDNLLQIQNNLLNLIELFLYRK